MPMRLLFPILILFFSTAIFGQSAIDRHATESPAVVGLRQLETSILVLRSAVESGDAYHVNAYLPEALGAMRQELFRLDERRPASGTESAVRLTRMRAILMSFDDFDFQAASAEVQNEKLALMDEFKGHAKKAGDN